jgi:hypothetical protein
MGIDDPAGRWIEALWRENNKALPRAYDARPRGEAFECGVNQVIERMVPAAGIEPATY